MYYAVNAVSALLLSFFDPRAAPRCTLRSRRHRAAVGRCMPKSFYTSAIFEDQEIYSRPITNNAWR